jgi:hypothetical protein
MTVGLNRMALSHLIVTLAKWTELYKRYATIIPSDVRDACKRLDREIRARGVVAYRNAVVGHILDKATGCPLSPREVEERLQKVIGSDKAEFFRWINDPASNTFPMSVVAITEHLRDRLRAEYSIRDQEIV